MRHLNWPFLLTWICVLVVCGAAWWALLTVLNRIMGAGR